jgi:hypothetical protein
VARFLHFFLHVGTTASDEDIEKRGLNWGVLRVYDGDSDRIICTAATLELLLKVLRACGYKGQVRVVTARCVEDLPIPSWEREIERAEQIIKTARKRGDKRASRRLTNAVRSAGVKRGPKRTAEYNRARIEELRKRMEGKPLKQIASTYKPDVDAHAVSVRLGRFCGKVGQLFILWGEPDISAGWDPQFAEIFAKELNFEIPDELPLVRYALQRCGVLEKICL